MKLFGRLLGSSKAIDALVDTADALFETKEEKRDWKLKFLEAIAPFKVVQRILAFAAAVHWLLAGLNVIVAMWVNALTSIDVLGDAMQYALSDYVLWPTLAVFSLYCGGGFLESRNRKTDAA